MNQPLSRAVEFGLRRSLVTLAHASIPRLKLANTSLARLRPIDVSRYSRRRGRPAVGFSKKASNTRSVCNDIRTLVSLLPIVESLHRVEANRKLIGDGQETRE